MLLDVSRSFSILLEFWCCSDGAIRAKTKGTQSPIPFSPTHKCMDSTKALTLRALALPFLHHDPQFIFRVTSQGSPTYCSYIVHTLFLEEYCGIWLRIHTVGMGLSSKVTKVTSHQLSPPPITQSFSHLLFHLTILSVINHLLFSMKYLM